MRKALPTDKDLKVFISSTMNELADLRENVADALFDRIASSKNCLSDQSTYPLAQKTMIPSSCSKRAFSPIHEVSAS